MLRLMSGTKILHLLQDAPNRELSEFYDGIALFMKLYPLRNYLHSN